MPPARLFTVIMDFEGTTSAVQLEAESPDDAARRWRESLGTPGSYALTDSQRQRLSRGLRFDDLGSAAALTGLQSVWCAAIAAERGGLALLNIVETVRAD